MSAVHRPVFSPEAVHLINSSSWRTSNFLLSAPWRRRKKSPPLPCRAGRGRKVRLLWKIRYIRATRRLAIQRASHLPSYRTLTKLVPAKEQISNRTSQHGGAQATRAWSGRTNGHMGCLSVSPCLHLPIPGWRKKAIMVRPRRVASSPFIGPIARPPAGSGRRRHSAQVILLLGLPQPQLLIKHDFPPLLFWRLSLGASRAGHGVKTIIAASKIISAHRVYGGQSCGCQDIPGRWNAKIFWPTPIYLRSRKSWFLAVHHLLCDFCDVFQKMTPD